MTLLEESFHIVGHVLEINLHDIWLKMGFTLQWQKPPAGRVQSLGAAQSLENKKKSPRRASCGASGLWQQCRPNRGLLIVGRPKQRFAVTGVQRGSGGFLVGRQRLLSWKLWGRSYCYRPSLLIYGLRLGTLQMHWYNPCDYSTCVVVLSSILQARLSLWNLLWPVCVC
jgi:hypothetical protein